MIIPISSVKNENIKQAVRLLEKSKERRKEKLTVVEGINEINNLLKSGIEIVKIFFYSSLISEHELTKIFDESIIKSVPIYSCSKEVFSKISYRKTTGGIVCIVRTPEKSIEDIKIENDELIIVLESIEKPGNLGAVCRIADGSGIRNVIVCDQLSDIYNPNTIRSSIGCVFNVNVVSANSSSVFAWLKSKGYKIYAAELNNSNYYYNFNYNEKSAFVFGTEAYGLSDFWLTNSDYRIKIPMLGINDSLNISVSVAVIVYEALRQRSVLA